MLSPMEIFREFTFEAAHRLPNVPQTHKCARLHGHSFQVSVSVEGSVGAETGWVADFDEIDTAFAPIHAKLDHQYLNEVDGLQNPTSEVLARWIWDRLHPSLPQLYAVAVRETCRSGAVLRRNDGHS